MRWILDADSISLYDFEEKAKRKHIELLVICDVSRVYESTYAKIRYVDTGRESVDYAILNEVTNDDIVFTQDCGLAAILLSRNVRCRSKSGRPYRRSEIDSLIARRYKGQCKRRIHNRKHNR